MQVIFKTPFGTCSGSLDQLPVVGDRFDSNVQGEDFEWRRVQGQIVRRTFTERQSDIGMMHGRRTMYERVWVCTLDVEGFEAEVSA